MLRFVVVVIERPLLAAWRALIAIERITR